MNTITNLRDMRATPLDVLEREYWSKGIPALPGEPLPPRDEDRDPSTMTLDQLIATQRAEMPSIARSAWLAGARVDSLDLPPTEDGTDSLAENIPTSHPAYDSLVTLVDVADMTPEQRKAYDAFCADFAYKGGSIPYTIEDPAVRSRITWERHWRQSGDVTREGFRFPDPSSPSIADGVDSFYGRMQFYSLIGRRLAREEFLARKQAFVTAFLARTGLDAVPDAATFAKKRETFAMLRNVDAFAEAREAGEALTTAEVEILATEEPADEDFAHSYEAIDPPYIPSLALLIYQVDQRIERAHPVTADHTPAQLRQRRRQVVLEATLAHRKLEEAAEAEIEENGPATLIHIRSARDAARRQFGSPDALWHGTLIEEEVDPSAVSLGTTTHRSGPSGLVPA